MRHILQLRELESSNNIMLEDRLENEAVEGCCHFSEAIDLLQIRLFGWTVQTSNKQVGMLAYTAV